eukprot:2977834-Rhodomonas_salina.2
MTTTRGGDDGAWKIGPAGRQGGDERRQLSEFERSSHICSGEEIRSRSWDGGGSKAFPRRYRCAWRHAARIRIAWILVVFATLDVAAPMCDPTISQSIRSSIFLLITADTCLRESGRSDPCNSTDRIG